MTVPSGNGSFFPIRLDRYVVAENGSNIVEAAFFVSHGDQSPVAVPGKDLYTENRDGPSVIASRCSRPKSDNAKHRKQRNRREGDSVSYSLLHLWVTFSLRFIYLFYLDFAAACSINSATSRG